MDNYSKLNTVLVRLFNEILDYEEKAIITSEFRDITNNDMHVIDAIGIDERKNMSTIAASLSVTVGSLTIAMNGLVRKGYVVRQRSEKDRRVVYIELSGKGRAAFFHHMKFHQEMIEAMLDNVTREETEALISALNKVDVWMRKRHEENEK